MLGSAALIKRICAEYKLSRQAAFEIVSHFCGITKAQVLADSTVQDEKAALDGAKRCAAGEPLQYIIGQWDFCGKKIYCERGVLIPREDTETLVGIAAQHLKKGASVLDLCCGSGCISVAMADLGGTVTAVDIEERAIALTNKNAELWGVSVDTQKRDILVQEIEGDFDIILSNPPYIPTKTIKKLDKSVKDYEPHLALDGGADGLTFYRRLTHFADKNLKTGGLFACEIGFDQKDSVCEIFKSAGYEPECMTDGSGMDRVVYFIKK